VSTETARLSNIFSKCFVILVNDKEIPLLHVLSVEEAQKTFYIYRRDVLKYSLKLRSELQKVNDVF
jgi:hypothetical protein